MKGAKTVSACEYSSDAASPCQFGAGCGVVPRAPARGFEAEAPVERSRISAAAVFRSADGTRRVSSNIKEDPENPETPDN